MENLINASAVVAAVIALTLVLAWPVQFLWNTSLVPAIDGVNQISFWQALGINFLASILFKGAKVNSNNG